MDIPYFVLLIIYFVGVGIFFLWTFFNIYHIVKFGFFDFNGRIITVIFSILSLLIFIFTAILLKDVPWLDTFNPMQPFSNVLSDTTNFEI